MALADSMGGDLLLVFPLVVVFILGILSLSQRKAYQELGERLERETKKLEVQQEGIKKLEDSLRDYIMGGKSLHEWKAVKLQVEELSGLPSFVETPQEYVLKIHLSMTKKDDIRVIGISKGINVTIESKTDPPIQSVYMTQKEIDPSKLKVTYKGNTLEIKAPKLAGATIQKTEEIKTTP